VAVHADQQARVAAARTTSPGFGLLVAAESASALAAVEMAQVGLPWRADVHDQLLEAALGPRPVRGGRPQRMQTLAEELAALLGDPRLNPDSQPELLRALRRNGIPVASTRRHELRRVDHPVVEPLLRYRELARLHAANGWAWREQWVRGGRFRPEYVPGGVVSGRWASRGGGALQIPRAVRGAVVAEPGRVLVVADAGQLEPRVLAAMSRDRGLIAATQQGDLYAALATQALGRPDARAEAKLGMLSAMYGGGAGSASLAALRRRFPAALELLEDAAHAGEEGASVHSMLGRASPPARGGWLDGLTDEAAAARARAYGRFTRNFVVQASAADWASVLIAGLRARLHGLPGRSGPGGAQLVFFQHDEVVVETPQDLADAVIAAIADAGTEATGLVLGDVGVRVPLDAVAVRSYADKP
jgi:DNA polymerase-1